MNTILSIALTEAQFSELEQGDKIQFKTREGGDILYIARVEIDKWGDKWWCPEDCYEGDGLKIFYPSGLKFMHRLEPHDHYTYFVLVNPPSLYSFPDQMPIIDISWMHDQLTDASKEGVKAKQAPSIVKMKDKEGVIKWSTETVKYSDNRELHIIEEGESVPNWIWDVTEGRMGK